MVEYEKEKDAGDSEEPQFPSRFLSFSQCEQEMISFFLDYPPRSVRWKYTVSSDDNTTANLFIVFIFVSKLENFHDIIFLR